MNRYEALIRVQEAARKWKVTAHPDDYDPTDEELVDLFLLAYNMGRGPEPYIGGDLESMGTGVHSSG